MERRGLCDSSNLSKGSHCWAGWRRYLSTSWTSSLVTVYYAVALTSSLGVQSYVEKSRTLGSFECHFVTKSFWWYLSTTSPPQLHQTRRKNCFWLELINVWFGNLEGQQGKVTLLEGNTSLLHTKTRSTNNTSIKTINFIETGKFTKSSYIWYWWNNCKLTSYPYHCIITLYLRRCHGNNFPLIHRSCG